MTLRHPGLGAALLYRHPGLEPGPALFLSARMDSDWQPCIYILARARGERVSTQDNTAQRPGARS